MSHFESPERIWIESDGECPYFYHEEELSDVAPPVTEYVRADKLRAEIEALRAEVERLRTDLMESDEIREKLGHLLTRTAAALKGEPSAGVWHSWHDLPEKAAQLTEALRGWWEARRPVGWTEDQHRSCPHVNLVTNAEKALADAMLKVKEREASND